MSTLKDSLPALLKLRTALLVFFAAAFFELFLEIGDGFVHLIDCVRPRDF